jgi:hypothetical protein
MSKSVRIACLLVALGWAATAHAQAWYSISSNPADSGGQAQIGGGLPLPIQLATSSMGGTMSTGGAIGTGMNFPPLLIPVGKAAVQQTAGPDPKQITVPVGAFRRHSTVSKVIGVALNNPTVYQVQTNLDYTGPAPAWGKATFKAGGRTGNKTTTFIGIPGTVLKPSIARYSGSAARFGGPSRTKVVVNSPIQVWAHGPAPDAVPPCTHPAFGGADPNCLGIMLGANPMTLAVAGAKVASPPDTTPGGFFMDNVKGGVRVVKVAATGLVLAQAKAANTAPISNMATSDGFPWTTGMLTLSQPTALGGPEVFTITGNDGRVGGVGTLSLVSGALSDRNTSGPNSNRSWAQYKILPEPGAVLGAAAALAVLGVCHGLVRRRSR